MLGWIAVAMARIRHPRASLRALPSRSTWRTWRPLLLAYPFLSIVEFQNVGALVDNYSEDRDIMRRIKWGGSCVVDAWTTCAITARTSYRFHICDSEDDRNWSRRIYDPQLSIPGTDQGVGRRRYVSEFSERSPRQRCKLSWFNVGRENSPLVSYLDSDSPCLLSEVTSHWRVSEGSYQQTGADSSGYAELGTQPSTREISSAYQGSSEPPHLFRNGQDARERSLTRPCIAL
jgi:hypothetical protein